MRYPTRRDFAKLTLAGAAAIGLSAYKPQTPKLETPLDYAFNGFYATTDTQCYQWCMDNPNNPAQPMIMEHIAREPVARWVMEGDNTNTITTYLDGAMAEQKLGVLVAYNIPNRDMGQHSAGGAQSTEAYALWAEQCAKAIGNRPCMVVLEPDSLMHMVGKPETQQTAQCDLLNHAIAAFAKHAPNAWLYVDAGTAGWPPAKDIVPLFTRLDTQHLRGFSINVSNYYGDGQCAAQAETIMELLTRQGTPLEGWVYDSSRNGNGAAPDNAWCNPAGRKLGKTASANYMSADANLWIKLPGESDGECGAYPDLKAGVFSPKIAFDLIRGK